MSGINDDPIPALDNQIEYAFKLEWIMAMLQGKKLELYDRINKVNVIFHPPQGGVFMTHEKYNNMRRGLWLDGLTAAARGVDVDTMIDELSFAPEAYQLLKNMNIEKLVNILDRIQKERGTEIDRLKNNHVN